MDPAHFTLVVELLEELLHRGFLAVGVESSYACFGGPIGSLACKEVLLSRQGFALPFRLLGLNVIVTFHIYRSVSHDRLHVIHYLPVGEPLVAGAVDQRTSLRALKHEVVLSSGVLTLICLPEPMTRRDHPLLVPEVDLLLIWLWKLPMLDSALRCRLRATSSNDWPCRDLNRHLHLRPGPITLRKHCTS